MRDFSLQIGADEWQVVFMPADELGERLGATVWEDRIIYIYDHPQHSDPVELFGTIAHEILHARIGARLSEKAARESEMALIAAVRIVFGI